MKKTKTAEAARLQEARDKTVAWRKWGPYLSERQWGTVREDYSDSGNAWDYFTHDQARSRAYRWGEDGIAGISDDRQILCFAVTLWNGRDPILKERLFGLTNAEGNHGEDVKEYYFYLDSTPTHSYMKYLYKYPQQPYPYVDLIKTNLSRGRQDCEYELIDTGIFDEDRYFDVFVEYAKESPEDILIQITAWNRGPGQASLHLLPTLWFRNTWSWFMNESRPELKQLPGIDSTVIHCYSEELGSLYCYAQQPISLLFTENETNMEKIFRTRNRTPYVKDGFHDYLIQNRTDLVNPEKKGTKACAHYSFEVQPHGAQSVCLRLCRTPPDRCQSVYPEGEVFGTHFDNMLKTRLKEADDFYDAITAKSLDKDQRNIFRQAIAGMLWGKQYYYYDVDQWLEERGADPMSKNRRPAPRNENWFHMLNSDVISMPDKWEYPWYAAWDLAFHIAPLALVDEDFGKQQLDLMLRGRYLHPNGQIPAYEWNFSDVNPPVHAWATWHTYLMERSRYGKGDIEFLKHSFQKLLLNFTWWVNRKDPTGRNVFEGGFLGLDNIGVFDRSAPLPTGGYLEQADGTAWMAFFSQCMLQITLELTRYDYAYAHMANKFFEHFLWIASAMDRIGDRQDEMWDEADGFFYDLLRLPDGNAIRLRVRSLVGLLPLCAATVYETDNEIDVLEKFPEIAERAKWFLKNRPELTANIHLPTTPGYKNRRLLSILDARKLRKVLAKMLDEQEFLSPYGIRSLSRYHADHPYLFYTNGREYRVDYMPAESDTGMFGGNSNWRGPIWMPTNTLIIRALLNYHLYYGDDFKVECPTGSGREMTLFQTAEELSKRLVSTFLRNKDNSRPIYGDNKKFQNDPHWNDLIHFYEYFHGDNGRGLGASHQTGWTGMVASFIDFFASTTSDSWLEGGFNKSILKGNKTSRESKIKTSKLKNN